jgi:hypothetical protein
MFVAPGGREHPVPVRPYLTPVSDIVALLTFERASDADDESDHAAGMGGAARSRRLARSAAITPALRSSIDALVAYMLFADEAPLSNPLEGVSAFTRTFTERGPRDHKAHAPFADRRGDFVETGTGSEGQITVDYMSGPAGPTGLLS